MLKFKNRPRNRCTKLSKSAIASMIPTPEKWARASGVRVPTSRLSGYRRRVARLLGGSPLTDGLVPPGQTYQMDFAGRPIDVVVDSIAKNLVIPRSQFKDSQDPTVLNGQTPIQVARDLALLFPATIWAITSIRNNIMGVKRAETSHNSGKAVDIGPVFSYKRAIAPETKSPRLAQQIPMLIYLANAAGTIAPNVTFVAEDDHFHVAPNIDVKGVVAQIKYHPGVYANDTQLTRGKGHATGFTFKVGSTASGPSLTPVSLKVIR